MYGELFNEANDEAELSAFLISPTRQAVALARAYNSKERKLQINSTSRADEFYDDEDEDGTPAFIQVIEQLREEAENRGLLTKKREMRSVWSDVPAGLDPEIPFIPAVEPVKAEPAPEKTVDNIEYVEPDYSDFKFDSIPPIPVSVESEEPIEVTEPEAEEGEELPRGFGHKRQEQSEPEKKLIIPLAVLFAMIAIPITVALVCLLLVPTFGSLAVSGACLYVGFKVTLAAFAGFSMFSDIMVVLGSGVIILALGLLFLWLFIWFIGGAIAGLINAVIRLGGELCSREVQ